MPFVFFQTYGVFFFFFEHKYARGFTFTLTDNHTDMPNTDYTFGHHQFVTENKQSYKKVKP